AKTDPGAGNRGISCFVVERDFGLGIGKLEDKLGVRGSPTGEVLLDGARVPVENRIGEEGQGLPIAVATLARSRATIGAQANGIQLLGGYGYVKDFPMERYFRDAKVTQIYEGTNQVQRVVIARRLLADR